MTNRILLIVTAIVLVLLVLSGSLIYMIISSNTHAPAHEPAIEQTLSVNGMDISPAITGTLNSTVTVDFLPVPSETQSAEISMTDQAVTPTSMPAGDTTQPSSLPTLQSTSVHTGPSNLPPLDEQCNRTGSMTTSLILEDSYTYEAPFGAELIRLTGIDFEQSSVVLLSLSSYIELPTSSLNKIYGIPRLTLGTVYHTVYQRSKNLDERHSEASLTLNRVINENFGIAPDHYISVNKTFLNQFANFAGPVEIVNPLEFSTSQTRYPAGAIMIDSSNIWDYLVSNKDTSTEYFRLQRQDILLAALFEAVHTNHTFSELQDWLQNHQSEITTDMDVDQLAGTFCALSFSDGDSIQFKPIPEEYFSVNPATLTIVDPAPVITFIDQQLSFIR